MTVEIKTPSFPESVSEGEITVWHKAPGDSVNEGDILLEVETDKVVMEVPATTSGTISKHLKAEGDTVTSEEILGFMEVGPTKTNKANKENDNSPKAEKPVTPEPQTKPQQTTEDVDNISVAPSVRRSLSAQGLSAAEANPSQVKTTGSRTEERVKMTRLRKTIAKRLLDVQQNNAILTTFNEVDMQPVMDLRKQYKDKFEKSHGVRLGFMSFFVKATTEALKLFPEVNASIDGDDIVYHNYCDISIAVSSPRGLVVPVLRNVENMSMADVEKQIREFAAKAKEGTLSIEDMQGGNFTITNGGTFGSMLSTPIINSPQSAILGMHNIVERPVAIDGEVVIRPIMYLALSYDHRIIDGAQSVTFLKTIKEFLEEPARVLLQV